MSREEELAALRKAADAYREWEKSVQPLALEIGKRINVTEIPGLYPMLTFAVANAVHDMAVDGIPAEIALRRIEADQWVKGE